METSGPLFLVLPKKPYQAASASSSASAAAVADGTGPSVTQAIQGLRSQGRRHIAVGSFFLTADELFQAQADLALRGGAVAVSDPIGAAREVLDLVLARYAFAAMDLLDFAQAAPTYVDFFDEDIDWQSA